MWAELSMSWIVMHCLRLGNVSDLSGAFEQLVVYKKLSRVTAAALGLLSE